MLQGKAANILCPVKLIMVMALRTGTVQDVTIEGVVRPAQARRDKFVVWTQSGRDRPLLPKFNKGHTTIIPEEPAVPRQLRRTLEQASDLAGLIKVAKPHDLRRGAARDVVYTRGITYINEDQAADVLNHSSRAKENGVTKEYIGYTKEAIYSKRVEQFADGDDDEVFGMEFGENSFKSSFKKRLTPAEVSDYCTQNNMDPTKSPARRKAFEMMKKRRRLEWAEGESGPQTARGYGLQTGSGSGTVNSFVIDLTSETDEEAISNDDSEHHTPSGSRSQAVVDLTDEFDDSTMLDQEEQQMTGIAQLEALMKGSTLNGSMTEQIDAVVDMIDLIEDEDEENERSMALAVLQKPPMEFIGFCSRINAQVRRTTQAVDGNSRDKSSAWIFVCKNASKGCKFTSSIGLYSTTMSSFAKGSRSNRTKNPSSAKPAAPAWAPNEV